MTGEVFADRSRDDLPEDEAAGSAKETDPTEGVFLEPLGLYLLVERRGDRIRGSRFSPERPDKTLPDWWKEVLLRCWLGGSQSPSVWTSRGSHLSRGGPPRHIGDPPRGDGDLRRNRREARPARRHQGGGDGPEEKSLAPHHTLPPGGGVEGVGGYSPGVDLKRRILEVERGASPR